MDNMIKSYNAIVKTMNKLIKEGKDVWAFHDSMSGYGCNVILEDKWIRVYISYNGEDRPCTYYINSYEKIKGHENVLDEFGAKELGAKFTNDSNEVYKLIKELF